MSWYTKSTRQKIERSLASSLKVKIKQLRKVGRDADADALIEAYQETLKRIRFENRIINEEGRDLINALEHGEQLRSNPDMPGTLKAMEDLE